MNCDLGWLRLFVGTGLNHFYGGFNTPGHSTPIYFTSSVLPNSPGYLQLPFFILIGPLITVPSSNARTQCSITLTQHLCVCVGGVLCFCCFVFCCCYFSQASFGSRIYLELFKEKTALDLYSVDYNVLEESKSLPREQIIRSIYRAL